MQQHFQLTPVIFINSMTNSNRLILKVYSSHGQACKDLSHSVLKILSWRDEISKGCWHFKSSSFFFFGVINNNGGWTSLVLFVFEFCFLWMNSISHFLKLLQWSLRLSLVTDYCSLICMEENLQISLSLSDETKILSTLIELLKKHQCCVCACTRELDMPSRPGLSC